MGDEGIGGVGVGGILREAGLVLWRVVAGDERTVLFKKGMKGKASFQSDAV